MKYTTEIEISLPREKVIEKFDNADNLKEWQPNLVSYEHMSGEPGQNGAKARLKYKMGKREIEMIETITNRDLPQKFDGTYETRGVMNIMKNEFHETEPGKTKWVSHQEFNCRGMMWIMTVLMPGAFKKQTKKFMKQFKEFAETSEN